ncbi:PDZ domain-containing protein [Pedobacter sp. MC2016-14]|uniref:PDZ domain-containing protein n=1 Tax=Pedobacter sp. MC2016-14 TaxID=2897327 RepID=UPI001E5DF984|nr:PDZ domain-containing protein [Pedobacter sp. MC2016-14]MCD0486692.1 PDZ domain-containing protein [Pedobacter sp. MC2016-14]
MAFKDLGDILISPSPTDAGKTSAIGSLQFTLPALYSGGYLGASLSEAEGKCKIVGTTPKSPADLAGLQSGDEIETLNGLAITSTDQLIKGIQKNAPDHIVKLVYQRDGKHNTVEIKLGKRPLITSTHIAEKFLGGKSIRYDGFKNVFVHDAKILPTACGGPVFNLDGKFIGINMARYSRTSSVAITLIELNRFVNEAVNYTVEKRNAKR